MRAAGDKIVRAFVAGALPAASDATRAMVGDLIIATLSAVGKEFSESPRTDAAIEVWADAMADMFCVYMQSLQSRPADQ